ncbi:MAG: hypothetical protein WCO84_06485 [bacterium]
MIFNNSELLSYDHQSIFFGGDVIRYRTNKNLEVQGYLLNLTNSSGVSGILTGISALESLANDWDLMIINGYSFGSGRINNISFPNNDASESDVRKKKYSISLEIQETGSLNNLPTNDSYAGINFNNYKFVESLTETLSLTRNFEKDVYVHDIAAGVSTSNVTGSLNLAKQIARNLFESNNFVSYLGNYYGISGTKSIYEESYDKIKGTCSFNQTTEYYANQSGNYSINKEYSYKREQDGVVTVSEKGMIKTKVEPYIDILSTAYQYEWPFAAQNCQDVFNAYAEPNVYPLNKTAITNGVTLSRYEKLLSYEQVYSNNLSINSGYFWEYSNDSSIDERGEVNTKEQGSVVGRGHRVDIRYNNALAAFPIVKSLIVSRNLDVFNRYNTFAALPYANFVLTKTQETYHQHVGDITYNYNFSNDVSLVTGDPYIIKSQVTFSKQEQLPLTNKFNVFNYGEIEQSTKNFIVSKQNVKVDLKGLRTTPVSYYLKYALDSVLPAYKGDFLTDVNYTISPFSNSFSLDATWGKIYEP